MKIPVSNKMKELKQAVKEGDNENVHGIYDEILIEEVKKTNPKLLKKLDRLVEGIDFWYA